jgi:hypothetical protein
MKHLGEAKLPSTMRLPRAAEWRWCAQEVTGLQFNGRTFRLAVIKDSLPRGTFSTTDPQTLRAMRGEA